MGEEKKGGGKSGRGSTTFYERELKRSLRNIACQLFTHSHNLYIIYIIRKLVSYFGSATLHEGWKIITLYYSFYH